MVWKESKEHSKEQVLPESGAKGRLSQARKKMSPGLESSGLPQKVDLELSFEGESVR